MSKFVKKAENGKYVIETPLARLSWVFIFREDPNMEAGDDFKWRMTMMFPKNAKALKSLGTNKVQTAKILADVEVFRKEIQAMGKDLAEARFGAKWNKKRWDPMLDGDALVDSFEGNADFWLLRVKTKFEPRVSDKNGVAIDSQDAPEGLYSGCWARAFLGAYAYEAKTNAGVSCGLGKIIRKIANDEEFTSGGDSEDPEFSDDLDDLDIDDADFDDDAVDADDEDDELA